MRSDKKQKRKNGRILGIKNTAYFFV